MKKIFFFFFIFSLSILLSSFSVSKNKNISEGKSSCKLQLKSFYCDTQEDFTGGDDVYFKINGKKYGTYRGYEGKTKNISSEMILFDGSTKISMYEYDLDGDDFLGSVTIYSEEAQKGEQSCSFTGDGANYTLYYQVYY